MFSGGPDDVPISVFDALSLKTRALWHDASANASTLVELLTPRGGVANALPQPFQSLLLPNQTTLLACVLAAAVYIVSWQTLSARTHHAADEEDAPMTTDAEYPTKPHQNTTTKSPIMRFIGLFVFLYRCILCVGHFILNRCIPGRDCSVYLRGFSCAEMPDDWTVSTERFRVTALRHFGLADKAAEFCLKLIARSGIGEQTYFPPGLLSYPPDLSMKTARAEADYIFTNVLDQLFASTGIKPRDVDILIVNCSLFAPTPSLAAMIINKYKMREDINSYNLSGMGCSAGIIALHLAKDQLRAHPNSIAVIVSTELITQQIYTGNETNMLLQNSLFRSGGAAIALTNKSTDWAFGRAKYELEHTVRTTLAADNQAYHCVFQDEDSTGHRGVKLEKELMSVAGRAMQKNISRLGPKILPYTEQIKFGLNFLARWADTRFRFMDRLERSGIVAPMPPPSEEQLKKEQEKADKEKAKAAAVAAAAAATATATATEPGAVATTPESTRPSTRSRYKSRIAEYVPNFKTAVDHICIHAGGRAVIDAIQAGLNLSEDDVLPSRATLRRYGNTSSSSVWYEFRYCEQNRNIQSGQRIWQLGFGSGFKCNSAIWRKL